MKASLLGLSKALVMYKISWLSAPLFPCLAGWT